MESAMPCDSPECLHSYERAITVEREACLAAVARAEAAERTLALHDAELAVLRPRVHELEARIVALLRRPLA